MNKPKIIVASLGVLVGLIGTALAGGAITLTSAGITSPLSVSSANISFVDAGTITVGGANHSRLIDGDLCLGTTAGAGACNSGPDFNWNPNNFVISNITGGGKLLSLGYAWQLWSSDGVYKNIVVGEAASMQSIQSGRAAMTAGALAVTFASAFSAVPSCRCTHEGTSINCGISVAPTTSGVTFAVTGGTTDFIDWDCIGNR